MDIFPTSLKMSSPHSYDHPDPTQNNIDRVFPCQLYVSHVLTEYSFLLKMVS
jgi:hypothetical protein